MSILESNSKDEILRTETNQTKKTVTKNNFNNTNQSLISGADPNLSTSYYKLHRIEEVDDATPNK
jgi:hypothetical protein